MIEHFLAGQLSQSTRRVYETALVDFFTTSRLEVHEVTRDHVIAYRNCLMRTYSASTVAVRLSGLSRFFEEAKLRGIIESNPTEGIERPKLPQESSAEWLTEKEAVALLATCDRSSTKGSRDYALLKLMLFTGLRRSEVMGAHWGDIGQERDDWTLLVWGKGRKVRKVNLQVPLVEAIEEYFDKSGRERRGEAPLFVATQHNRGEVPMDTSTIAQIVKARAKKAGIQKRITPHSLRHTAITLALDGGATVRQVQQMVGHTNPGATVWYDHRQRPGCASDYIQKAIDDRADHR